MIDLCEWIGTATGLLGAFLLATHSRFSPYGWVAFLLANIAMLGFAWQIQKYGLFLQQLGFLATSVLGIHRAGLLKMGAKLA